MSIPFFIVEQSDRHSMKKFDLLSLVGGSQFSLSTWPTPPLTLFPHQKTLSLFSASPLCVRSFSGPPAQLTSLWVFRSIDGGASGVGNLTYLIRPSKKPVSSDVSPPGLFLRLSLDLLIAVTFTSFFLFTLADGPRVSP